MSLIDEAMAGDGASSGSFWEINNYRRTVRRTDNAHKLATELSNFINERAEIEKNYAQSLQRWSKDWNKFLKTGIEYGTTQASWLSFCREAERISEVHTEMRTKLLEQVQTQVKNWQKESFHKQAIPPGFKETRGFEADFVKAQKPWAKKFKRVQDCRKEYHNACKVERSCRHAQQNAKTDAAASADQHKKLQDKLTKAEKDVEKSKGNYDAALKDLSSYNPKYMEDMTEVFNRAQSFENERLAFFKDMFIELHRVLNVSVNQEVPTVYEDLMQSINAVDPEKDLRWWSMNHGVDMAMQWPQFEEYSTEMHAISKKKGGSGAVSLEPGVTLTGINHSRQGSFRSQTSDRTPPNNNHSTPSVTPPATTTAAPLASDNGKAEPGTAASDNFSDDGGQYENVLYDDGRTGIPVKALYDYEGVEFDELTFKAGDHFEKLEEEDEQGWCKGRKDGRVGLYPANYVEEV